MGRKPLAQCVRALAENKNAINRVSNTSITPKQTLNTGDTVDDRGISVSLDRYCKVLQQKTWKMIHDDRVFQKALDWGFNPEQLKWLAMKYDTSFLREIIVRVNSRRDTYFRGGGTPNEQRCRLFFAIVRKEGVPK